MKKYFWVKIKAFISLLSLRSPNIDQDFAEFTRRDPLPIGHFFFSPFYEMQVLNTIQIDYYF